MLSQGEGDRVVRRGGSDKESAGGGSVAGLGLGGRGGAEELLDRAVRSGLPLHSRKRSEDEWEVSSGGSGERERSITFSPLSSRTRLLRLRFPPCCGLRRPLLISGTFREWGKDRRECEVVGLGAESGGCSLRVIVDL